MLTCQLVRYVSIATADDHGCLVIADERLAIGYGAHTIIIENLKAVYIEAVGSTAPVQFDVRTMIANRLTDSLQLTAIESETELGHNTH